MSYVVSLVEIGCGGSFKSMLSCEFFLNGGLFVGPFWFGLYGKRMLMDGVVSLVRWMFRKPNGGIIL